MNPIAELIILFAAATVMAYVVHKTFNDDDDHFTF